MDSDEELSLALALALSQGGDVFKEEEDEEFRKAINLSIACFEDEDKKSQHNIEKDEEQKLRTESPPIIGRPMALGHSAFLQNRFAKGEDEDFNSFSEDEDLRKAINLSMASLEDENTKDGLGAFSMESGRDRFNLSGEEALETLMAAMVEMEALRQQIESQRQQMQEMMAAQQPMHEEALERTAAEELQDEIDLNLALFLSAADKNDKMDINAEKEIKQVKRAPVKSKLISKVWGMFSKIALKKKYEKMGLAAQIPKEGSFARCSKIHRCGHRCGGIYKEHKKNKCLPCIHCILNVEAGEGIDCIFCFESIEDEPTIQLECKHIFHADCCQRYLQSWYNGPRITFSFATCPLCKAMVNHWALAKELEPINTLLNEVQNKALKRLDYEDLTNHKDIVTLGSPYYRDPTRFAMDRYVYHMCFKCKKPYFVGAAECGAAADEDDEDDFKPEELVCPECTGLKIENCPKHGLEYINFKCRYCCSLAVWFCFGDTHFCEHCHNDVGKIRNMHKYPMCPVAPACNAMKGSCPLKIEHAPTGEEFALGCGLCNNISEI